MNSRWSVPPLPGREAARITQWEIRELRCSVANTEPEAYLGEPQLTATFSHLDGDSRVAIEGFWDGGTTWGIRFAPSMPGVWEWQLSSTDTGQDGRAGRFTCEAPSKDQIDRNPNLRGHVGISASGRFFTYADGTPCFLLADTVWAINTLRCGIEQGDQSPFRIWLRDRLSKGYTAALIEFVENNQANEGGFPFPDNTSWPGSAEYRDLNPGYFRSLDQRIQGLWEAGLVIAAHPTWIGKQVGMTLSDALWLSRYLLARYGAYNLIWSLSGEYQYAYTNDAVGWTTADWSELGEATQRWNPYHHPVSVHPSGRQEQQADPDWPRESITASSAGEFHDASWLDHNWLQTGQSVDRLWRVPQRVAENYALEPVKPVFHSEGLYERNHPEGATPEHIRWQAWVAFLNGAAGHGYGASGIFQFYDPESPPGQDRANSPPRDGQASWRQALEYPGSAQLAHLSGFFRPVPWWRLVPHRDHLTIDGAAADIHSLVDPHCAIIPGKAYIVYVPVGNEGKRIQVLGLESRGWTLQWYNPRTGIYAGECDATRHPAEHDGVLPDRPDGEDWVALLDLI